MAMAYLGRGLDPGGIMSGTAEQVWAQFAFQAGVSTLRAELTKLNDPMAVLEIDVTDLFGSIASQWPVDQILDSSALKAFKVACDTLNAKADGLHDDTFAVRAALYLTPGVLALTCCLSGGTARPAGAATIRFPIPADGSYQFYRITETIDIEPGKQAAFLGTCPGGATLRLTDPDDPMVPLADASQAYLFRVDSGVVTPGTIPISGIKAVSFERLNLVGGGIRFAYSNRHWKAIRDCTFRSAPEWAVKCDVYNPDGKKFGTSDVVNVEISRCTFVGCGSAAPDAESGAISVDGEQSAGWEVRDCCFVANPGIDLHVDVAPISVTACEFVGKPAASKELPYVHLEAPGLITALRDCRFGDERTPPAHLIVIGLLADDKTWDSVGLDVLLDGCTFGGPETKPQPGDAASSVLCLRRPMRGLRMRGCTVWSFDALVREEWMSRAWADTVPSWNLPANATDEQTAAGLAAQNLARDASRGSTDNLIAHLQVRGRLARVFTEGGRGFEVQGLATSQHASIGSSPLRSEGNLLVDLDWGSSWAPWVTETGSPQSGWAAQSLEPLWQAQGATPQVWWVDDALAPGGLGAIAFRRSMMETDENKGILFQRLSHETSKAVLQGGRAVFSVWMRTDPGVTHHAGLEVTMGGLALAGSRLRALRLTDEWRRYHVVVERLPDFGVKTAADNVVLADGQVELQKDVASAMKYGGKPCYSIRPLVVIRSWPSGGLGVAPAVFIAQPQLELGDTPTAFAGAPGWWEPRTRRQEQASWLGNAVVGFGTEMPTSGRHLRGDLVMNLAPAVGGPRGWLCVQSSLENDPPAVQECLVSAVPKSAVTIEAPAVWSEFGAIEDA